MRRARATGRPVPASALTTPTSITVARPDGQFALTESAVPVRADRNGRWETLNPALHRNINGTLSTAVTTSALTLSGGGNGPLAVMSSDARTLSVSWPGGALPTPTVSGATATYASVFPGVDLAVTADAQGAFSEVLIVKTAAAAVNPALTSLQFTATAPGLAITATSGGNLQAAPGPGAVPVFTAGAPLAWDSAPPPASMPTVTDQDGTLVGAQTGLPADSSAAAPGAAAHSAMVPVSVSGNTITLSPPASVLASASTVYPVYIDPTWWPAGSSTSAWTQVNQGYPTTSFWKESSDLQSGLCPASISPPNQCGSGNGVEVARSFIRLPIPSKLESDSVVNSAYLYMTEKFAPSCTKTSVRLYTTGGISSSTTWNNQPSWSSGYSYQDLAFGYPGCQGWYKDDVTWDVTSTIKGDVGNQTTQTWGIRAADETDQLGWKLFANGSAANAPHMTVNYNDPPDHPSRSTDPGGSCQYSPATATAIGNDDVKFAATVSDDDPDSSFTTRFIILNSAGKTVYDSNTDGTPVPTGNHATAYLTLSRPVMQGLQTGGATTEYAYHWYAMVTDQAGLTNSMPTDECYFTYNPNGPTEPAVTLPASGTLGAQVAASFSTPGCGTSSNPCPVSYSYQLGAAAPVRVNADSSGNWSGNITIPRVGPMTVSVTGTASNGNLSETATPQLTGTAPATPYTDGDFDGSGQPDLLTPGTGTAPSLWLAPTNGSGTLATATDIGGAGTGITPGADGPADWAGTVVTHGDFTGNHVQDVMAYYPTGTNAGTAIILAGSGDGAALQTGNSYQLSAGTFADPLTGDNPVILIAAGNASQTSTGTADLIGVTGDATNGYSLDLFTDTTGGGPTGYGYDNYVLSAQSPDGASPSDWNNFTLATAQPGNNPSATVLFALNTSTGALYESANPNAGTQCSSYAPIPSTCTLIGTPQSIWTPITTPWGASAPALLSADINSGGQPELWARSGTTITAYTLTGSTLATEHSGSLSQPLNDWPLAEGAGTTTTDTMTGQNATLTGGATWITDDVSQFGNHIRLDGTGYLTPPASAIPTGTSPPKISVWFKTTTAGGVLVSMQKSALSSGPSLPSQYDPVLYIGTDGKLYGEWWNGSVGPAVSTSPVNDGIWHHAVLTATTTSQTLTLDGVTQQTLSGATSFQFTPTNLAFGAGYIGGNWPSEPNYQKTNSSDYRYYFNGEIADITYSYPGGP